MDGGGAREHERTVGAIPAIGPEPLYPNSRKLCHCYHKPSEAIGPARRRTPSEVRPDVHAFGRQHIESLSISGMVALSASRPGIGVTEADVTAVGLYKRALLTSRTRPHPETSDSRPGDSCPS
jgi:hypothetical protein